MISWLVLCDDHQDRRFGGWGKEINFSHSQGFVMESLFHLERNIIVLQSSHYKKKDVCKALFVSIFFFKKKNLK